jgi:ZIP family zinc transporter
MENISPILLAFIATMFTWFITSLGAAVVYFFKKINKNILDAMLSLAAGVMIAASFFSLIAPSIEMAKALGMNKIIITSVGFICGGLLLVLLDKIFSKRISNSKKRCLMLVLSITLHNIPEGLAIGVAFGSIIYHLDGATIASAMALAIGIGIQNFPEGIAVSMPLRREGFSRTKSFLYGGLSGIVEPIAGVLGALLVLKIRIVLPFFLAFAAGAMIYVVASELIPESQTNKNKTLITMFSLIGFTIMMILDVLLA